MTYTLWLLCLIRECEGDINDHISDSTQEMLNASWWQSYGLNEQKNNLLNALWQY